MYQILLQFTAKMSAVIGGLFTSNEPETESSLLGFIRMCVCLKPPIMAKNYVRNISTTCVSQSIALLPHRTSYRKGFVEPENYNNRFTRCLMSVCHSMCEPIM